MVCLCYDFETIGIFLPSKRLVHQAKGNLRLLVAFANMHKYHEIICNQIQPSHTYFTCEPLLSWTDPTSCNKRWHEILPIVNFEEVLISKFLVNAGNTSWYRIKGIGMEMLWEAWLPAAGWQKNTLKKKHLKSLNQTCSPCDAISIFPNL